MASPPKTPDEDYQEDEGWKKKKKAEDLPLPTIGGASAEEMAPPSYQQATKAPPPRPPPPGARRVLPPPVAMATRPEAAGSGETPGATATEVASASSAEAQSSEPTAVRVIPTGGSPVPAHRNQGQGQGHSEGQGQGQAPTPLPRSQPLVPRSQDEGRRHSQGQPTTAVPGAVRVLPPGPESSPPAPGEPRTSSSSESQVPSPTMSPQGQGQPVTITTGYGQPPGQGGATIMIPQGSSMTVTVGQTTAPGGPPPAEPVSPPPAYTAPAPPPAVDPLTFVDFTEGPFSAQFRKANAWLQEHREYKAVNCETVEIPRENEGVSFGDSMNITDRTYFSLRVASNVQFIRLLRLWLVPRPPHLMAEIPQQLGYTDLIPLSKKTKKTKFESMQETVTNFNERLKKVPLSGQIMNIQTLRLKYKEKTLPEFEKFDENYFTWIREGEDSPDYYNLSYLRLYHEVGRPAPPGVIIQIGIEDFIPKQGEDAKSSKEFESLLKPAQRAQNWINENQTKFVFAAQCINHMFTKPPGSKFDAKTYKTLVKDSDTGDTRYLKFLRVYYQWYLQVDASFYPEYRPLTLTYKTFCPERLTRETKTMPPVYETIQQTWRRATAWLKVTGVRVIGVETFPIRVYPGVKCVYGDHESTYVPHRADWQEFWLFAIRVFINGSYVEPPGQLLPPLPVLPTLDDKSNCTIL